MEDYKWRNRANVWLRTSDIAEALHLHPNTIAKTASVEGIRGIKEGIGRGKQAKYTQEQAERIARAYRSDKGIEQLHKWLRQDRQSEKKSAEKKSAEIESRAVQRALSESYSRMAQRMTAETDWWIEAITKIGHSTVLVAFQEARVPPELLYEEIKKFKSAEEFIAKVEEYMVALYEAKNDAKSLLEKEKENKKLYYKLLYTKEIAKELARRLKKMESMYNLAVLNLDEEGIRKLATVMPLLIRQSTEE